MAEGLEAVYLITGSDRPKIRIALHRLRGRFEPDAVEVHSAADVDGEGVAAACNALGLFAAAGRLVVVEGVEAWKAADAKAIAAYLAASTPDTVLALVGDGLRSDSTLAKECARAGAVLLYDVPKRRSLPGWVAELFARRGASVDAETCRLLVDIVGEDADALESEVDKLVTWAGDEPIGEREVQLLAVAHEETPSWDVTDAWGRRDVAAVLRETETLFERSHRPRRDEVARVAASLTSQLQRVSTAKRLAGEGIPPAKALGPLGVKWPFQAETAFRQAQAYDRDELLSAVVRVAGLDRAIKGGSRLPGELELTRALIEVTSERAER